MFSSHSRLTGFDYILFGHIKFLSISRFLSKIKGVVTCYKHQASGRLLTDPKRKELLSMWNCPHVE